MKKRYFLLFILFCSGIFFGKAQTYTNLVSMDNATAPAGQFPYSSVLLNAGGKLYGMSEQGGANGDGVFFSYNIISNTYTDLEDFDGNAFPQGGTSRGSVINMSGILYGMTYLGGANFSGNIFSYNIGTSTYTDLYDFTGGTGGSNPFGSFVAIGNVLYGVTYLGGSNNCGNIFSYNISTNTYTNLYNFTSATGKYPLGTLMVDGGILYGMTNLGGANSLGCLFSFNPAGNVYTDLVDFNGASSPEGAHPQYGVLTLYNNKLYGMTYEGGADNYGIIFSYDPVTTTYTDLYDFTGGAGGKYPDGSLLLSGNTFFGMSSMGGISNFGNIFSFNIITNSYTDLYDFTGGAGSKYPYASLTLVGNLLYGMTVNGGVNSDGNIFSFLPACTLSATVTPTNIVCNGENTGDAIANISGGTAVYTYSWSNGSSTVSTSNPTGAILSAGAYTVTITDNTAICTATATVTITQPNALSVSATTTANATCFGSIDGSATSSVSGGTPPYTYSWSNSATTPGISTLFARTYSLEVIDNNGCIGTATAIITQPPALTLTKDSVNAFGLGPCIGEGSVYPSGGTPPYTYLWDPGGETTGLITHQCEGRYCCTVTDNHGCKDSTCVTIVNVDAGINNTPSNSGQISVYPNPANGIFTFVIAGETKQSYSAIEIYNVLGQKVYSTPLNLQQAGDFEIDLSSQPNGIYFYRVLKDDSSLLGDGKLIIEK